MSILETEKTYVVTGVQVVGSAETEGEASDNCLRQARAVAFAQLRASLKQDVQLRDDEIDSVVIAFTPHELELHDGIYSALYDIVFDKNLLESTFTEKRLTLRYGTYNESGAKTLQARLLIGGDLRTWISVKNRLNKAKCKYIVSAITTDYIDIVFRDGDGILKAKLRDFNMKLIQNNQSYFIRLS